MSAEAILKAVLLGEDRSASKAVKGVGDQAQKTSGHLHSLGKIAAGVFAGGALFVGAEKGIEFLKGSAEAAVQNEQANAILGRQLKNTTGATDEQIKSVEEWTTKTSLASGVAKADLTPTLTRLATVTGSVTKAQKLTTLAMNVAAGTHQKLSTITGALVRAQNGSVSGLSRLGIATKNADGTTKSFTQVQAELAKQFKGDTAAAAQTAGGQMARLGVTWEELKVTVGEHLLPVLTSLSGWLLDDGIPAAESFGGWVKKNREWLEPLVAVIAGAGAGFAIYSAGVKVAAGASTAYAAVQALVTTATEAETVAQGELDAAMDANPIGLVVVALAALAGGLIYAYTHSETFRKIVQGAFHGVEVAASAAFGWIKSHWALLFTILGGPIGLVTVLIVKNFSKIQAAIQVLGKWATWLWNNAFQPALHFIVTGIGFMVGIWAKMLSALGHVPGFGWAKDAGAALQSAADKAAALANNINKIPTHKSATVVLTTVHNVVHTTGGHVPAFANGVQDFAGGVALVGERGPEIVTLPRGSSVYPHGTSPSGGGDVYVTVNTNGLVDKSSLMRELHTELKKYRRVGLAGAPMDLG